MEKVSLQWKPQDVIAAILVVGLITLKCLGHDSVLSWALLGIVGTYYGVDLTPIFKIGRNKGG